jgi:hypothetical protein
MKRGKAAALVRATAVGEFSLGSDLGDECIGEYRKHSRATEPRVVEPPCQWLTSVATLFFN